MLGTLSNITILTGSISDFMVRRFLAALTEDSVVEDLHRNGSGPWCRYVRESHRTLKLIEDLE